MKYFSMIAVASVFVLSSGVAQALTVGVSGDTSAGVDVVVPVSASASVTTNASTSASDDTSAAGSMSDSQSASMEGGSVISITRADVSAAVGGGATVTPSSVQTGDTLSAYASSVVQTDADVDSARLSDSAVSLGYKARAKLFGIIPVFVNATATVNADGGTTISYPWYAFLATTNSDSLKTDVEAATASTVQANTSTSFSAQTQAQLLDEMHAAMKASLQASLAAEGSTDASAQ